jgi:hypothetical protein
MLFLALKFLEDVLWKRITEAESYKLRDVAVEVRKVSTRVPTAFLHKGSADKDVRVPLVLEN